MIWHNWTPTVTQSGSVAATVDWAQYTIIGNTVILQAHLSVTGSGTTNNAITIGGLPAGLAVVGTINSSRNIGSMVVVDASGGVHYSGYLTPISTTTFGAIQDNAGNYIGIAPNFALASGDRIGLFAIYPRT